jgi:hypothetical protein
MKPPEAPDDPFDGVTFDEAFVRDARVREETADQRVERWRHIDAEHRRIIEEARANVRAQAAANPHLVSTPTPRRTNRARWAVIVVGLLVVTFFWVRSQEGEPTTGTAAADLDISGAIDEQPSRRTVRLEGGQPPPGVGAQPRPIGRPPPLPAEDGPHAFVATQPNGRDPVAYDPCRPIHVVVNERTSPAGGAALVRDALDRISETTGLQFVVDGPTTELPVEDRPPYQPDRYPGRWAPVLVAWSDAAESPALEGEIAGQGGSSWFELDTGSVFVSGLVVLDGPDLADLLGSARGRAVARGIVLHELGHLVGLGHVGDASQLMFPETSEDTTDFAAGDLRGLAALGTGQCFPEV